MTELVIERCDPREQETEIKALFARNGKPEFAAVFERAYRPRADHSLTSWIGRLGDQAVLHISVTRLRVHNGANSMVAGILGDLMVDESHRDFWAPMRLVRTMIADVRCAGQLDFLLTTTVKDAEGVFKAGGFKPFGTLRRFVLPLIRPYLAGVGLRVRATRLIARARGPYAEMNALVPLEPAGHWRAESSADYYTTRIPRDNFTDGTWITVEDRGGSGALAHLLLCRSSLPKELTVADVIWSENRANVTDVLLAAGNWARGEGFRKLSLSTLQESRVATQLARAGFFTRPDHYPLLARPLGRVTPAPVDDWFLAAFALSSW